MTLPSDEAPDGSQGLTPEELSELRDLLSKGQTAQARSLAESLVPPSGNLVDFLFEVLGPPSDLDAAVSLGPDLPRPRQVGPYRLIESLGQGAQGSVYLAEDTRLQRRVALKLLANPLTYSSANLQRFQREAEVTSRLDDPGICSVYEAGEADGVHFIAMRYVEGTTLAAAIRVSQEDQGKQPGVVELPLAKSDSDRAGSSRGESSTSGSRAAVLRVVHTVERVARSLHVAHEAGLIHRDIKPGNIMITDSGDPVILDFGLAREEQSDAQALTLTGDLVGTPAYVSPEQIEGVPGILDQRTDVYSLGVTLFECLTLQRPFGAPTREALYRRILDGDRPDPRKLNPQVPADLRVILETALEPDRDRRYQTALDFAEDLRRLRIFEPIHARQAGPLIRFHRWMQRNPVLATATLVLFVSLAGGLSASLYLLDRVDDQRREAELQATSFKTVNDFLNYAMLQVADPKYPGRQDATIRELLDAAGAAIEEGQTANVPTVEATLRTTLGTTYEGLGIYASAEPHLVRAHDIRLAELGPDHPDTLDALNNLGLFFTYRGRYADAEPLLQEAYRRRRESLGEDDQQTLTSVNNLGLLRYSQGHPEEAEELYRKSLAGRRRVLGNAHEETVQSITNLAFFLSQRWRHEESEPLFLEALEACRLDLRGRFWPYQSTLRQLAYSYFLQGRYDEADPLYAQALELIQGELSEDHPQVLMTKNSIALLRNGQGHFDEAEVLFDKVLAGRTRVLGERHVHTLDTMSGLARVYANQNRLEEAEELFGMIIESRRKELGPEHEDTLTAMNNLASILLKQQRLEEAEELYLESLDLRRAKGLQDHPDTLILMSNLGKLYGDQGRVDEAGEMLEQAVERARRGLPEGHWNTGVFLGILGSNLMREKRFEEAETALLESHAIVSRALGASHTRTVNAMQAIVRLYEVQGLNAKAAEWRERLVEAARK